MWICRDSGVLELVRSMRAIKVNSLSWHHWREMDLHFHERQSAGFGRHTMVFAAKGIQDCLANLVVIRREEPPLSSSRVSRGTAGRKQEKQLGTRQSSVQDESNRQLAVDTRIFHSNAPTCESQNGSPNYDRLHCLREVRKRLGGLHDNQNRADSRSLLMDLRHEKRGAGLWQPEGFPRGIHDNSRTEE